ncbi:MAG: putative NADPH-dependent reductase [Verrucomicrobiales bacterium]|jgi:NAD(P)H-dependent FMN reductase|nr:putative NADPH-dependent reductase [Verrucomicrobiales bacterium]
MSDRVLKVLAVSGSRNEKSVTRIVIREIAEQLKVPGIQVDVLDFFNEPLELFNPDTAYNSPLFPALKKRVEEADVLILGTPDYHGSISSALKSFLDHFWHEFAGKLFASVVASNEKGLTVTDQIRTVARQCYAWTMPYGISFAEKEDIQSGVVSSDSLKRRVAMLVRDISVYGRVIAEQRLLDLNGNDAGFMARYRKV